MSRNDGSAYTNYRNRSYVGGKGNGVEVSYMDMPEDQFQQVLGVVVRCLDRISSSSRRSVDGVSMSDMVKIIKSTLDAEFGPVWSIVMGNAFGMFVTYEKSQFAHFYVGPNEFVVFKAFGAEGTGYYSSGYNARNTDGTRPTFLTPTGSRASRMTT